MADGRGYPGGIRPPLQDARAVGCYQPAEATAADYRPVPLSASALVIGGMCLATTGRAFRARCQLAADRLGFAVPARGLLPTSASGTAPPELCGRESPCDRGQ